MSSTSYSVFHFWINSDTHLNLPWDLKLKIPTKIWYGTLPQLLMDETIQRVLEIYNAEQWLFLLEEDEDNEFEKIEPDLGMFLTTEETNRYSKGDTSMFLNAGQLFERLQID